MTTNSIDSVTGKLLTNGLTDDWTMLIQRSNDQFYGRLGWLLLVVAIIVLVTYLFGYLVNKYYYPEIPPTKKNT
jgi:hypothetical protein